MMRYLGLSLIFLAVALAAPARPARAQDAPIATARSGAGVDLPPLAPVRKGRAPRPLGPIPPDPFESLRDEAAPETQAWTAAQTRRARALLTADARFAPILAGVRATLIQESPPQVIGGRVYVLTRDAAHPAGLWRGARLEDYLRGKPRWEVALDLGALGAAEGRAWRRVSAVCDPPRSRTCLVQLSDGRETLTREFDLAAGAFRSDGFRLPPGTDAAWLDGDTLLVAAEPPADATPDAPRSLILRRLKRGEPMGATAEAFRIDAPAPDARLRPMVLDDGAGHQLEAVVVERSGRAVDLFVQVQGEFRHFPLPENFTVVGVVGGRLVIELNQGWTSSDLDLRLGAGQLLSFDMEQIVQRRKELTPTPVLNMSGRPYILQIARTRSALLLTVRENDGVRLYAASPGRRGWSVRSVVTPPGAVVTSVSATPDSEEALVSVERFPEPSGVFQLNAATLTLSPVPTGAADPAAAFVVEPAQAVARDGAKLDYLTVRAKGAAPATGAPTLLLARSDLGLELGSAETAIAAAWLASGGLLAVPTGRERAVDVRNAPLRTLLAYNDLASIALDLTRRGLAQPGKVALAGAGQGGLIAAIAGQRARKLWAAVALIDPTVDVLRPGDPARARRMASEYGDLRDGSVRRYWDQTSPYDNVRPGVGYPPTLIVQSDRGEPSGDGRRYAARLQQAGAAALFLGDPSERASDQAWPYADAIAGAVTFLRRAIGP